MSELESDQRQKQNWVLGVHRLISAALYRPSGVTIDQYLQPPYDMVEISRKGIFQFEVVVGDLIMVYPPLPHYPDSLTVGNRFTACITSSIRVFGLVSSLQ